MAAWEGRVPPETPDEVKDQVVKPPRVPKFDPTLGVPLQPAWTGSPRHRLVLIGDSLMHGFQSGAIFNTDLSVGAIVAHELGWEDFRHPRYQGPGGLPLNIELLLRDLESRYGSSLNPLELPLALFRAREFLDQVEDYWERGPGREPPQISAFHHALAVYGWDLRDVLSKTAATCAAALKAPNDDVLSQVVENNSERAALRVYPHWSDATRRMTLLDAARAMGRDRDQSTDCGIETLVVFLGSNNALQTVTRLRVVWSGADYADPKKKSAYTVWRPEHFRAELDALVSAVKGIRARHVIWCTVPHVTIAPIARGVGEKITNRSRYFPYYTRPWVKDAQFNPAEDPHITGPEARAVDCAIDMYNTAIEDVVEQGRRGADGQARDWYLLDTAGMLDRLASRRFITDVNARPPWWTPYPLPAALRDLDPVPDSRFLLGDGQGGRASGGLFSLDGVHPTTVGYGVVAQEIVNVMRLAGVEFRHPTGAVRSDPVTVDFARLIARDTLIRTPPQSLRPGLDMLGWADETLDFVRRALTFKP